MDQTLIELAEKQLMKDQFAKVILGATAGFIAGKLTEKLYDAVIIARRVKNAA